VAVRNRLSDLADDVLNGTTDRADAAVVGQLLGTVIRAITAEVKVRETVELEERLDNLEAWLLLQREGNGRA
jgi:outer membrane lipoprotein SlyB